MVASEMSVLLMTVFQSSAAARLKVVPLVELVPFLFSICSTAAWSVAFTVTLNVVALVTSTLEEVNV